MAFILSVRALIQEQASLELEKKAIEYNKLAREVESNRALYDSVLKRMKETDMAGGLETK